MRDMIPAMALFFVGLAGLSTASLLSVEQSNQYLVVAAPWSDLGKTLDIVKSVDGSLIEVGGWDNIVIAFSPDENFADRARNAGMWFVLPSPRLASCFGLSREIASK